MSYNDPKISGPFYYGEHEIWNILPLLRSIADVLLLKVSLHNVRATLRASEV
jgi:hypothetical protein